ncbi:ThiF family adenylyltransferase [Thalassobaculum sp. OXR-137]|nr:ThiF family adenylyltransferase [Thalassobaculum sp. OXR-137]WPZ35829.1 ThiF family adenylyltransferase [Thalassobaculum sp. OXR-137]
MDDGYEVGIDAGHLVIHNVPYVDARLEVRRGKLVAELALAGDATTRPRTHVVMFAGSHPCDTTGKPLNKIKHQSQRKQISEGLNVDHSFSSKPVGSNGYEDYYHQMTTYIAIIEGPARAIDPSATTRTCGVVEAEDDGVFNYADTASSRAGISALSGKLTGHKVGIIGLGGTGSYILDTVAKTPVPDIHLFDGDDFLQHNAFRSPGAPTIDELRAKPNKAEYWAARYAPMRQGIHAHGFHITAQNAGCLDPLDLGFVFICIDKADAKRPIIAKLEELGIPFIDVGMGLELTDGKLHGQLRVTMSTPARRTHVHEKKRIGLTGGDADGVYSHNIQIAELNQMNAALAVIRWKKWCAFFLDLEGEHHSIYTLDGNLIINEDKK